MFCDARLQNKHESERVTCGHVKQQFTSNCSVNKNTKTSVFISLKWLNQHGEVCRLSWVVMHLWPWLDLKRRWRYQQRKEPAQFPEKFFMQLVCFSIKVDTCRCILLQFLSLPVKSNKGLVAFNKSKAWPLETSEACGVLNESGWQTALWKICWNTKKKFCVHTGNNSIIPQMHCVNKLGH